MDYTIFDKLQTAINNYLDSCNSHQKLVQDYEKAVADAEQRISGEKKSDAQRMHELEKLLSGSASGSLKEGWSKEAEALAVKTYSPDSEERSGFWQCESLVTISMREVNRCRAELLEAEKMALNEIKTARAKAMESSFFDESYMLQQAERLRQRFYRL